MTSPLMVIAGIVAIGLLFVVAPVVIDIYRRYCHGKMVTCPEVASVAEVALNIRQAVVGATFGHPLFRVKSCSLWPKKIGCAEKCVKENWPAP